MTAATVVVGLVTGVVAVILLLPTISDVASLLSIARGTRRLQDRPAARPPRLLFLVPAHDEELLIESCIRSVSRLRYPAELFRVVVVADNCRDRTAMLARGAGAECLERDDLEHPGKPHAIAWALERLPLCGYDAVVIVDADTILDAEFANEMAKRAPLGSKAVQAYFDVRNPDATPLTRMAAVLAAATHGLANPLKQRAGLNVPLVGNGMCFGTEILARYGWHAFSIGEDCEMYALLTADGVPIECAPGARVYAQEARSLAQSSVQRQRWTAGRLTALTRAGPRVWRSRRIGMRQRLDVVAELAAPGPATQVGLVVLFGALAVVLAPPAGPALVGLLAVTLLRPITYAAVALARQPDRARAMRAFAFLPAYTLWRIGALALAVPRLGDGRWVRTMREGEGDLR